MLPNKFTCLSLLRLLLSPIQFYFCPHLCYRVFCTWLRRYSIFSVAKLIASQADPSSFGSLFGLHFTVFLFVLCSFIVPVLQILCLSVMWSRPLTLRSQKKHVIRVEILAAWQYLEVYLIAIVIATLQIGTVSGFMVEEECAGLVDIFQTMVTAGVIKERDATCFYVNAGIQSGCWWLLGAAVMLNVSTRILESGFRDGDGDGL